MKTLTSLLALAFVALIGVDAMAQTTGSYSVTITRFVEIETINGDQTFALDPNGGTTSAAQTASLEVGTNANATPASVDFEFSADGGSSDYDDLQWQIALGAPAANGTVANSGSAAGTASASFDGSDVRADIASVEIWSGIKGGQFELPITFTMNMDHDYALAGTRSFTVSYTIN